MSKARSKVIADAIAKAGGVKAVASAFDMSTEGVRIWKLRGIPANHVVEFERISGVPRETLRPDLYRQPA